jgi:hypothetical protein
MGFKNTGIHVEEYVYDFAVDGGAKDSAIELHAKQGKKVVPVGAVIKRVTAKVLTQCTSGGSATVVWGNGDDADGYSGATIAVASLTANALFNGYDNAAALLWDDTNDHPIDVNVADEDDGKFEVLIETANLTAGKILFMVEYYYPATEA